MATVTNFVEKYKQPRGGFLPPKDWQSLSIPNTQPANEELLSGLHYATTGLVVEYLASFYFVPTKNYEHNQSDNEQQLAQWWSKETFNHYALQPFEQSEFHYPLNVSLKGFKLHHKLWNSTLRDDIGYSWWDQENIDNNIALIYFLAQFDSVYRARFHNFYVKPLLPSNEKYDDLTKKQKQDYFQAIKDQISHEQQEQIKLMSQNIVKTYKYLLDISSTKQLHLGFDIKGAENDIITAGDGDAIVGEYLIDIKTKKTGFTPKHTLQVLIYYLMGLNSYNEEQFQKVKYLALYNPKSNIFNYIAIKDIPVSIIDDINSLIGQ
ncbi:hypothetical protein NXS15_03245 [Mycoplasma sp. CSL7475-4]|uniref:hypothetical protein n=1 Tax=Mycoplasma sp. CSL7475-4 TaxID=2973942 RepID=UPI00216AD9B0|nr:hypothetical protein [Mycoplasma sp. CSL7475-4]MCS4537127.1 hypothetical protein [Mycoplasma sp. CSL7475-4]